jgi:Flp pilus assembly pilin Flp
MLRLTVQAQTFFRGLKEDLFDRMRREDGVVSVEYLGVVVIVAAVILAILGQATAIGQQITQGITKKITDIIK